MISVPEIFESAMAEVLIQHAPIEGEFPRIRTWRSIDDEGRWSAENDRVMPVIVITSSTPSLDEQGQLQVTIRVVAMTDASDDQTHRSITSIEAGLQDCIDALESRYPSSEFRPHYQTFLDRIESEMAGTLFSIHVGSIKLGESQDPAIVDGSLAVAMEVIISYSRSDR